MAAVARYIAGRLAVGIGTLLIVSVLVFGAVHLVPGNYADVVLSPLATATQRADVVHQYGLDKPILVQYVDWLRLVGTGNFGKTLGTDASVNSLLAGWIPVTAELALLSVTFMLVLGLPLALAAGLARSRTARVTSRLGGAFGLSMPDFVTGSILLYVFSRYHLWFTVSGYVPWTQHLIGNLQAMVLPAFTLGLFGAAVVAKTGRDAVRTAYNSPHVTAAIARGESRAHIVRHHVLRNAAIPVVTVFAANFGYLLGGAVIVEELFNLPGVGQATLTAINGRDYPVVEGVVLLAAAAFIAINMLADFAYGVIDPRVISQGKL
jgi:peptide/nickel transport system permease protein